jgi:hypothetical protein
MSRTPSPCPKCRAQNFNYRRLCWNCGRTLPTSFILEGTTVYSPAVPIAESTSDSKVAAAVIAQDASTRTEAGRAQFREVVRGLLERCGIL